MNPQGLINEPTLVHFGDGDDAMLTPFGKSLRKLRLDRGLLLKDMADLLDVSPSFLSAVESGKKAIPARIVDEIAEAYNLTASEINDLRGSAAASIKEVTIKFSGSSNNADREAAALLARTFENGVSDDFLAGLKDLLDRKR